MTCTPVLGKISQPSAPVTWPQRPRTPHLSPMVARRTLQIMWILSVVGARTLFGLFVFLSVRAEAVCGKRLSVLRPAETLFFLIIFFHGLSDNSDATFWQGNSVGLNVEMGWRGRLCDVQQGHARGWSMVRALRRECLCTLSESLSSFYCSCAYY